MSGQVEQINDREKSGTDRLEITSSDLFDCRPEVNTGMDCLSCGLPSGYNRVLVERGTGGEVGGLCIECEEHEFGDRLRWEIRAETEPDRCALCADGAHVRVPEWDPEMDVADDGTVEWEEYRVTEATPGLCDEHFGSLADRDSAGVSSLETSPRQSD
jgi:hypothetical protein